MHIRDDGSEQAFATLSDVMAQIRKVGGTYRKA